MWVVALFAQFAQADRADKDPFRQPEVIWGTAGLALALLGGALVIWLVDRWRKRVTAAATNTAEELTDFRGMYERGEITEEEYVRLRNKVSGRMKEALSPASPLSPIAPGGAPNGPTATPPAAPPLEGPPQNPPPSA